jgi:hypothetical protein
MTSLLFVEKGEEFTKKGVLSAAQRQDSVQFLIVGYYLLEPPVSTTLQSLWSGTDKG